VPNQIVAVVGGWMSPTDLESTIHRLWTADQSSPASQGDQVQTSFALLSRIVRAASVPSLLSAAY